MGREWTTRTFKSGNSVALRIPATVGIDPGEEWRLIEDGADFKLEKVDRPKRKFNVAKVVGSATSLRFVRAEDREFEDSPRPWDDPDWPGWESVRA